MNFAFFTKQIKPISLGLWGVKGTEESTPGVRERALRVRALARAIVLCSWARHFTLTVPLSTQVYKWVPAYNAGGNPAMD